MNYLIKYIKRLGWMFLSIIISLIVIVTLYYFNIISTNMFHILELIILLINVFISTFILGKQTQKKGYLEGIKYSLIIIFIFFILTLITREPLNIRMLLYYSIIIITSVLGSIIGISKTKENSSIT